jgi:HAD superfamily hydrolase (TIGR01549 family)
MTSDELPELNRVEAITFDFYNTLIFHPDERGRGRALVEYLQNHGLRPVPWEHRFLHDVFEGHATDYCPEAPQDQREAYYALLVQRVFERLEVPASPETVSQHARSIWQILGPASFDVFPDALKALQTLRAQGYPLAVISNWEPGLRHFCTELGLADYFDHILGSADLGVAKPDERIFADACSRLGVPADRVLHVGDTLSDDYLGGKASGLLVALLDRHPGVESRAARVIHTLDELPGMLRRPRLRHPAG